VTAALKLVGTKIGDWLLLSRLPKSRFLCRCICGVEKVVSISNMRSGRSLSCGCVGWKEISARVALVHGGAASGTKTREFRAWSDMRTRCNNPARDSAPYYTDKSISVCAEWGDYRVFLTDMGPCPKGFTLDRIKGHLGYSKVNCRWAPPTVQSFNTARQPGASGERGVTIRKGKAIANLHREGVRRYLGSFATVEEAAQARRRAEVEVFGFEAPR